MRIALFTNGIYPHVIGGIQKHSYYLAKHLAQQGVEVDVYFAVYSHIEDEAPEGLFTPEELSNLNWIRAERPKKPYFPSHFVLESFVTSQVLFETYQQHRPADFIYAQGMMGWEAIRAKRRGQALPPIGVNPHGLEMFQRPASLRPRLENWMFRPVFKWLVNNADVPLSLGGGLSEIMERIGVDPAKIKESPNGVGQHWLVSEVQEKPGPTRFVFIGRFERRKGVQELQAVLTRLCEAEHDFECHFIGPIPEDVRLSHPSITYWGLIRDEQKVQEILRGSDVLVCPSYSEGMPTVILEAMASGLAVIATKVGAVDAMVSDETGWIIPPGDIKALEQAMVSAIISTPDDLLAKKQAGRRCVEAEFTWDVVAEKTRQSIARVLGEENTTPEA